MSNTKTDDLVRTEDIPMSPGSDIVRARITRFEGAGDASSPLGDDPEQWGGYSGEAVFDNEDYDDPRHETSFDDLLAHPPTLRVFRYQNVDLEDDELRRLVDSKMFAGVQYLDIRRNFRNLTDEGVAAIIAGGALAHLQFLSIDSCYSLGDATVKAIAGGAMPKLRGLLLGCTELTDEGLVALGDTEKLPALQIVAGMFLSKITEAGARALLGARPGLRMELSQ